MDLDTIAAAAATAGIDIPVYDPSISHAHLYTDPAHALTVHIACLAVAATDSDRRIILNSLAHLRDEVAAGTYLAEMPPVRRVA